MREADPGFLVRGEGSRRSQKFGGCTASDHIEERVAHNAARCEVAILRMSTVRLIPDKKATLGSSHLCKS